MRPERASSMLDRRQRFTMSGVWDLPWFRRSGGWFAHRVLGGFTIAGTYTAESPEYATVQSGVERQSEWSSVSDRAIINACRGGGPKLGHVAAEEQLRKNGRIPGHRSDSPLSQSPGGRIPEWRPKHAAAGGINNFDLSLMKRLRVRERATL